MCTTDIPLPLGAKKLPIFSTCKYPLCGWEDTTRPISVDLGEEATRGKLLASVACRNLPYGADESAANSQGANTPKREQIGKLQ